MIRSTILAAALIAGSILPSHAQVVLDMSSVTCGDFLKADDDQQQFVAAWMSGYFSAAHNLDMVDIRYVARNHKVVGEYCERHKSDLLMSAIEKTAK